MNEQFDRRCFDHRENKGDGISVLNLTVYAQPGSEIGVGVFIDDNVGAAIDRMFDQHDHTCHRDISHVRVYIESEGRDVEPRHGETRSQGFSCVVTKDHHYIITVRINCMSSEIDRVAVTNNCLVHIEDLIRGTTTAEQLYAAVVAEFPVIEPTYC